MEIGYWSQSKGQSTTTTTAKRALAVAVDAIGAREPKGSTAGKGTILL
jgi:hypothetical protein